MNYTHKNNKFDELCGKKVSVKFWDNDIQVGILNHSESILGYKIQRDGKGGLHFYKSHVKKIEVTE